MRSAQARVRWPAPHPGSRDRRWPLLARAEGMELRNTKPGQRAIGHRRPAARRPARVRVAAPGPAEGAAACQLSARLGPSDAGATTAAGRARRAQPAGRPASVRRPARPLSRRQQQRRRRRQRMKVAAGLEVVAQAGRQPFGRHCSRGDAASATLASAHTICASSWPRCGRSAASLLRNKPAGDRSSLLGRSPARPAGIEPADEHTAQS